MSPFALLQRLAAAAETGMLFARTDEGHQVRIGLADGEIVHLSYAMRRGGEALSRLAQVRTVSASFTRGLSAERHHDLPPQDLLMQMLEAILAAGTVAAATATMGGNTLPSRPESAAPTTRPPSDQAAPRPRPVDDSRRSDAIAQLRALMVEFVGPIGSLLVDQEVQAGFRTWTELVDRLAAEVSPESEAQALRAAALRLLR
jgi:hypothetical protein